MTILIVGSGSYVIGDQYGPGVVLRSVLQWLATQGSKAQKPDNITLVFNSTSALPVKQAQVDAIRAAMLVTASDVTIDWIHADEVASYIANSRIAACFVSVPDKYHAHYTDLCMQNGVPLWLVKPLCGNWEQAQSLLTRQAETGANVWVDYHKRFDASNALLKIKAKERTFGRMLTYSVDYHQPRILPLEVFDWTKEVDVFTYIGCHYIDQIFYIYPEAKLLSATAEPVCGLVFEATGQYDGVLATLVFQTETGQIVCPMNIGWFNPKGSPTKSLQTVKVQFERGVIELDQTRRGVHVWDDDGVSEVNPYFFNQTLDLCGNTRFSGYGYESVSQFLGLVADSAIWPVNGCLPSLKEAAKTEYVLSVVRRALDAQQKIIVA